MSPQQKVLIDFSLPSSGGVFVNERVGIRTEGSYRIVTVHGVVLANYDVADRAAEAYAMVTLFESGYAGQKDIANAFGYSSRSLRRYLRQLERSGFRALGRPKGRPRDAAPDHKDARDRMILRLKEKGFSNRGVAQRLGLAENSIRKRLRRLGWTSVQKAPFLFPEDDKGCQDAVIRTAKEVSKPIAPAVSEKSAETTVAAVVVPPVSLDVDPLDRSMDRMLASMGQLEDAVPLFAHATNLTGAGALLAVPALVASGLLTVARKIYGSLGPAFYGLRTTLVAYIILGLLRIPRPENLKEHAPGDLGRVLGLDRILEVKTLRRKLARLASMKRSRELGHEMARRRIAERGRLLGFLYVDGHVRAYHGKRTIPKAFVTRTRMAAPATTDYWINDQQGDPLFVVTADANAAMMRMLLPVLEETRKIIGSERCLTVVFDRGGWSPTLFQNILTMGFDILTYRKGRFRHVSEKRFVLRKARLENRSVQYRLYDQPVRLLKGKLRLRQVTRLTDTGHQTAIVTSRWDLRDIEVAYRMFERWRQENFFKYMRQEYLIDALIDYDFELDDPNRSVPNPAHKEIEKELRKARSRLGELQATYGSVALDYIDGRIPSMDAFSHAEEKIHGEIREIRGHIAKLVARQKTVPKRIALSNAPDAENAVKLSTECKHLTNILKMIAYQIEGSLVELLRPNYQRTEDEGRTLIQTALKSSAAIEPTDQELRVTLTPLSSPHRSEAIRSLCKELNKTETRFPGTNLCLKFAVAETPSWQKSGQFCRGPCQEI
jgi:DNA-binding NarL/FixJ family response regulator